MIISGIQVGDKIDNKQLTEVFGCSPQGGMRRSSKTNTLVLISSHVVNKSKIYDDKIIGDVYHYTGMGTQGDQSLLFAQNKTLAESPANGVDLHFFEVFYVGEYTYMGQVVLVDKPYQEMQTDVNGTLRKVWMFPLKLLERSNPNTYIEQEVIEELYEEQAKIASKLNVTDLKDRAIKSASNATARITITSTYIRNSYIAVFTKKRGNGNCELCKQSAPFNDNAGAPYLESHHIVWLSRGGPDDISNTVALCPNCHKKMHVVDNIAEVSLLKKLRTTKS